MSRTWSCQVDTLPSTTTRSYEFASAMSSAGSSGASSVKVMVFAWSRSMMSYVATKFTTPELKRISPVGRTWEGSAWPCSRRLPDTFMLTTGGTPGTPGDTEYSMRRSGPSWMSRPSRWTGLGEEDWEGRLPPISS